MCISEIRGRNVYNGTKDLMRGELHAEYGQLIFFFQSTVTFKAE